MFSFILGLLPTFSKLFQSKWFIYVIIVLVIITSGFIIHHRAYNKGYDIAIELTEAKYAKEKLAWQAKINTLQNDFESQINGILTSYNGYVAELQTEIDQLQQDLKVKPKVRYIHKYVPVETNCTIPKGFVVLHNTAAQGKPLSDIVKNAIAPSQVSIQDVGSTVAVNYYEYNKLASKMKALQEIVKQFQLKQKQLK